MDSNEEITHEEFVKYMRGRGYHWDLPNKYIKMKHISLFNGIGGFQLAAKWMGWENIASCEIDKFCNKVTKFHFPKCVQHEDIRATDFTIYRGQCDILTGGFP